MDRCDQVVYQRRVCHSTATDHSYTNLLTPRPSKGKQPNWAKVREQHTMVMKVSLLQKLRQARKVAILPKRQSIDSDSKVLHKYTNQGSKLYEPYKLQ